MDHAENAQQPAGVDGWVGRSVLDRNGVALGVVTAVVPDPRGEAAWLTVAGAGVSAFVPSAGAADAGGQVKVVVGRGQVVGAPATTLPDRLSEFEAAALRRHYSRDADQSDTSGPDPVRLVAAAVALLTVVLWVVRRARRKPPTPAERLTSAGRTTTAAVAHRAKDLAGTAVPVVGEVAHDVAHEVGALARRGAHAGAELATKAAAAAVPVATKAAAAAVPVATTAAGAAAHGVSDLAANAGELAVRAAHTGQRVGGVVSETLAEVPEAVAERVDDLQKTWRKVTNRLVFVVFLALGYVLGARAGTERYDAIMRLAGKVTGAASSGGSERSGGSGQRQPDLQPLSTTAPTGHTMG